MIFQGDLLVDAALVASCPVACFDGPSYVDATVQLRGRAGSAGLQSCVNSGQRNRKTLAFWVAPRHSLFGPAPRNVRGFCMRMIDLVNLIVF